MTWQRFDSLPLVSHVAHWLPHSLLTAENAYPTHLLAYWEAGQRHPWFLATNLPNAQSALAVYRRRMWIEQLFGDLKGNDFDLQPISGGKPYNQEMNDCSRKQ